MDTIENMTAEITSAISEVEGVSAVVLGGSRARGTHNSKSDVDMGIYYHPDRPINLVALKKIAACFDDEHRENALTPIGGWGPWINGGGWLNVRFTPVDFLFRDLGKVSAVIDACLRGEIEMAYQPGHPHGFVSSIYLSEVAVCKILWESELGELTALKKKVVPFPRMLKRALIEKFGWEIDFSLSVARKAVPRGDVVYAAGCCFRAAACMLQVLFAINEEYWLNEKGAVAMADSFRSRPEKFKERIESTIPVLEDNGDAIENAIDMLQELSRETMMLVNNGL